MKEGAPKSIPKKIIERAEEMGGADLDYFEYDKKGLVQSCDKGGHRERSIANNPTHLEYWKKIKNEK